MTPRTLTVLAPLFLCISTLPTGALAQSDGGAADPGPTAPETENLLAAPEGAAPAEENLLAEPAASDDKEAAQESSFGLALSALGVEVTWSGYGDAIFTVREDGSTTFDLTHFNPIVGARIGESWRAELELEIEHAGEEIKAEYGFVEYMASPRLMVRAGKVLVPLGRFNDELHPSFRWNQVSRPAMFRDVVPAVWSDVGVTVLGTLRPSDDVELRYDLALVNGLGHSGDAPDPVKEPFRAMRDTFVDTNTDKGPVLRLGVRLWPGASVGDLRINVSGYTGAVDPASATRLTILDADASVVLGPVSLRGEFAQTFYGAGASTFRPWQRGSYLEATVKFGDLNAALRWDHVFGRPQLGSPEIANAFAASLMYSPRPYVSGRIEVLQPFSTLAWQRRDLSVTAMAAFSF